MGRAGRCGVSVVALCGLLLAVACGDASIDAYCEAKGKGNQDTLELPTHVLEKKHNQTGMYLARARCLYFLGSYAQALQDTSEVISPPDAIETNGLIKLGGDLLRLFPT